MPDRLVRDELLTSERYWAVSPEARNLFLSLILSADDTARYTGASFALRTKCMAGTVSAERIENLLNELVKADLVRCYQVDGLRFIFIPKSRQRLRFTKSRYPEPPIKINDIVIKKTDSSPSQARLKTAEVKRSEEKRSRALARHSPKTPIALDFKISPAVAAWAAENSIFNLPVHLAYFVSYAKAKDYRNVDWDHAFRNAVSADWAKAGKGTDPDKPRKVSLG